MTLPLCFFLASLILFTFLVPLNFRIMYIRYDVIREEGHVVLQLIITFLPLSLYVSFFPRGGGLQEYD